MSQSPQQRDGKGSGVPDRSDGVGSRIPLRDYKITITLTLPRAIFSFLFLIFLLIWAFIFGIMIGRGHNPEEAVPELARVMPKPTTQTSPPVDEDINVVLPSQELKYHDSLKGNDIPVLSPKPSPTPQQTPQPPTPAKPAAQKPTPPAQPVESAIAQQPDQDQSVYNYTYQVAAFNNIAAAQTMQKKLQNGGFSTKISQADSNGTTWYRILVLFKGKPEETRALRTKLAPYGISTLLLRGKTASR